MNDPRSDDRKQKFAPSPLCRVEMLGDFRVHIGDRTLHRFSTKKTAALLAYLAYYRDRRHSREVLVDLLWPESDLEGGRQSLSQALSSLRHQLEPPGIPSRAVITADRNTVGVNASLVQTDTAGFEEEVRSTGRSGEIEQTNRSLLDAIELYRGPLLPGFYESWIPAEQQRLTDLFLTATRQLAAGLEVSGRLSEALQIARRAVDADPLREESHRDFMRLLVAAGQPAAALRQYEELQRILAQELNWAPSDETSALARSIRSSAPLALETFMEEILPREAGGTMRLEIVPTMSVSTAPDVTSCEMSLNPPRAAGTVTLLMADAADDVKGIAALRRLREFLKAEAPRYGGCVEDSDGICCRFQGAGDALACAVASHRALTTGVVGSAETRIRIALHTVDISTHDGPPGLETIARAPAGRAIERLLAAAQVGQIVCSETSATLGRPGLDMGLRLVDLGVYRLRLWPDPVRVFQVEYPGMVRLETVTLNADSGVIGNLPHQVNRFFGRESEIRRLTSMLVPGSRSGAGSGVGSDAGLNGARLITLTGPGGTGKTRLALEVGAALHHAFRGAVWFVPLADVTRSDRILDTVLDALRLATASTSAVEDRVVDAFSHGPSLLILDNFEHLLDAGADVVRVLLERTRDLHCLVTSRRALALDGEQEFGVHPLATPTGGDSPQTLSVFESVQLFLDRAQAVRPSFQVTNHNAAAIAELCHRLEGIPLALELAAARAQVLSPARMLVEMERRFEFLTGSKRVQRHRTLRAAIDWSYNLLPPDLQRFFARLSVFRGGWTVDSAAQVCDWAREPTGDGQVRRGVIDALHELCACSLILYEDTPRGGRYRMLETLREYADEQLDAAERSESQRRHLGFALRLVRDAAPNLACSDQRVYLRELDVEQDNLRTALRCALDTAPNAALRMAGGLWRFWDMRQISEGREWLAAALAAAPNLRHSPVGMHALNGAANLALRQCDYAAARELHEENLSIARQRGDTAAVASTLNDLAIICLDLGDLPGARKKFEESLALFRGTASKWCLSAVLAGLGTVSLVERDPLTARRLIQESYELINAVGDQRSIAANRLLMAQAAMALGDRDEAARQIHQALKTFAALDDLGSIASGLELLSELSAEDGEAERSARMFGASTALRDQIGSPLAPFLRKQYQDRIDTLRLRMGEQRFLAAWEAGALMTPQRAVEFAVESGALNAPPVGDPSSMTPECTEARSSGVAVSRSGLRALTPSDDRRLLGASPSEVGPP